MNRKLSYLSKNVLLFSISGLVPKILAFLLVPIYTSYLTTSEYGISDLITIAVNVLLLIVTLNIQDAVMRFVLDKNYRPQDVFSAAMRLVGIGAVIVTLGCFAVDALKLPGVERSYLICFAMMYAANAFYNSTSMFCRGIDKVGVLVGSSIINSVVTLGSNILFLVVFRWRLTGYLAANTLGVLAAGAYCFFGARLYKYIHVQVPGKVIWEMVGFSVPILFGSIAWWVNSASDRFALSLMAGTAVSGLYAVAYKIPTLLTAMQNILGQAWSISAVKEFDKDDSDGFMSNMYTLMNFAMVAVSSAIMVVCIPAAKILYQKEFFHAWVYVPPLLLSVLCNAMTHFIGSIFVAVKDTKALSVSTIVGAAVNIVCNFLFIWLWGAYGAALATLLGYGVSLAMRHLYLRKHIRMHINWKRDGFAYGLLLAQMAAASLGLIWIPAQLLLMAGIILIYRSEIGKVLLMIKSKFRK